MQRAYPGDGMDDFQGSDNLSHNIEVMMGMREDAIMSTRKIVRWHKTRRQVVLADPDVCFVLIDVAFGRYHLSCIVLGDMSTSRSYVITMSSCQLFRGRKDRYCGKKPSSTCSMIRSHIVRSNNGLRQNLCVLVVRQQGIQ
jgi:hypothetical protein